jgi:hypothetical protein
MMHTWYDDDPAAPVRSPYSDDEKAAVRAGILSVVAAHLEIPVQNALVDAVTHVARHDFPDRWASLPDLLLALLRSGDAHRTLVGLRVFRSIARFYEHKDSLPLGGGPVGLLASALMPTVQSLAVALVDSHPPTPEAGLAVRECLKAYTSLVKYLLPLLEYTCREDTLIAWCGILDRVLRKPLPEPGTPGGPPLDLDARARSPWWKAKKRALRLAYHLALVPPSDYHAKATLARAEIEFKAAVAAQDAGKAEKARAKGSQAVLSEQAIGARRKAVITLFRKDIAPRIAETALGLLIADRGAMSPSSSPASPSSATWLSPKCILYALRFIETASDFGSVWRPLRAHLRTLIDGVCISLLRITRDDLSELASDPVGWLTAQNNVFSAYEDPRSAVEVLLHKLATMRGKEVMPILDATIARTMQAYAAAPPEARDVAGKEAVLRLLGLLNASWRRRKVVRAQLEPLLVGHVTPELASPHVFMRVRAIQTWSVFVDSKGVSAAAKRAALERVLALLGDPALPVRFTAAVSLSSFLTGFADSRPLVAPHLIPLIQALFAMLDEVGLDLVVTTINTLLHCFADQLPALAGPLTQKLVEVFLRMSAELQESEDEELDMTVEAVLGVLSDLVELLTEPDEDEAKEKALKAVLVQSVLPVLWPALLAIFGSEGEQAFAQLEFFSLGCDILMSIIEALDDAETAVLNPLWAVLARMLRTVDSSEAVDFATNVVPIASHLFSTNPARLDGPDPGAGNADYAELVVSLATTASTAGDDDCNVYVGKLVAGLLHFGTGRVDRVLPSVVTLYASRLGAARTRAGFEAALVPLFLCLHYSPAIVLATLAAAGGGGGPGGAAAAAGVVDARGTVLAALVKGANENLVKAVDLKIALLGWANLLRWGVTPVERGGGAGALPAAAFAPVVASMLELLAKEAKALAVIEARAEGEGGDGDDDDAPEEVDSEEEAEGKAGAGGARGMGGRRGGAADDGDGGDDGDDGDQDSLEDDEDAGIHIEDGDEDDPDGVGGEASSPLDHVDSVLFAAETLQAVAGSPMAGALQAALGPTMQAAAAALMAAAGERQRQGKVAGRLGPEQR